VMPSEKPYTLAFFDSIRDPARTSAEEIVPLALQMLAPHSVIDVGCATGEWLAVFREMGINDIAGVDGHYLDPSQLRIPREVFHPVDLAQPFSLFRQFDLVLCLEVGEHLPEGSAAGLVASLVRLGPAILFSAAIPYQAGVGHINEQWPGYWAELFLRHGFIAVDPFRRRIWQNSKVAPWYSQNLLLYAQQEFIRANPKLNEELERYGPVPQPLVHPGLYIAVHERVEDPGLRNVLRLLPKSIVLAVKRRLRK
jgi:SAM-dependent methyltransferase